MAVTLALLVFVVVGSIMNAWWHYGIKPIYRDWLKFGVVFVLLAPVADAQAVWKGRQYNAPVCNNRFCTMCNSIRRQLSRPRQPVVPMRVLQSSRVGMPQPVVVSKPSEQVVQRVRLPVQSVTGDPQGATAPVVIDHALRLLRLTPDNVVAEIGCGDGRVLIQAANEYGCRGVGVEIDPKKAAAARVAIRAAGLSDRIQIITGDARDFNPLRHDADVAFSYLYGELLAELAPLFRQFDRAVFPLHDVAGLRTSKHVSADDADNIVYLYERNRASLIFRPLGDKPKSAAIKTAVVEKTTRPRYELTRNILLEKFGAPWCAPCQRIETALGAKIGTDRRANLVCRYWGGNVDTLKPSQRVGVSKVPTLRLWYHDGNEWHLSKTWIGETSLDTINAAARALVDRLNK